MKEYELTWLDNKGVIIGASKIKVPSITLALAFAFDMVHDYAENVAQLTVMLKE